MKSNIEELIRLRIERFNRLYLKALGHTFEEDPKWCEEQNNLEMIPWKEKVDEYLKEHNLKDLDEFYRSIQNDHGGYDWNTVDPEFREHLRQEPSHSSLYNYELFCINQAKKIAEFIGSKEALEKYEKDENGNYVSAFDFVKKLEEDGFKLDSEHSLNSVGTSIRFAQDILVYPDLFPYEHGALCYLVGDEGYHDDRKDIPQELLVKYKK